MDNRERLLRFIKPWSGWRQYRARIGDLVISYDWLTDEALVDLADSICRDFWSRKRSNRECREVAAGLALAAQQRTAA